MNKSKVIAVAIISLVLGAAIAGVSLKFVCVKLGDVLNPAGLKIPS